MPGTTPTNPLATPSAVGQGFASLPLDVLSNPQSPQREPSYYDIPILAKPVWRWEIAWYFFLGGLSGGSFILGRMADRFGSEGVNARRVSRAGAYLAFAASLPCAPLLISDLGDPKRFHHMLRMVKVRSPMSVGTWVLTSYSMLAAAGAGSELLLRRNSELNRAVALASDVAGVPLALLLVSYTGILLSCTATPLWTKNLWLGALFTASAVGSGSSALTAVSATRKMLNDVSHRDTAEDKAIETVDTAAHVAEAACLTGYLMQAGKLARPLTHGKYRKHLLGVGAALVTAEVLKRLPLEGKRKTIATLVSAGLSLAGGLSLRWAFVYAGHDSAGDPHDNRLSSRPRKTVASAAQALPASRWNFN